MSSARGIDEVSQEADAAMFQQQNRPAMSQSVLLLQHPSLTQDEIRLILDSRYNEAYSSPAPVSPEMPSSDTQELPRQGRLPPTIARRSLIPRPLRRRTRFSNSTTNRTESSTAPRASSRSSRLRSLVTRISLVPAPLRIRRQRPQDSNQTPQITSRQEEDSRRLAERHYANTLALLEGREGIDWVAEDVDDNNEHEAFEEHPSQAEQPPILPPSSRSSVSSLEAFHDAEQFLPLPLFSSPSTNISEAQQPTGSLTDHESNTGFRTL